MEGTPATGRTHRTIVPRTLHTLLQANHVCGEPVIFMIRHAANLAMQANVWFNYAASKANVADLPSRGDLDPAGSSSRSLLPSLSPTMSSTSSSPRARATCRVCGPR